MADIQPIFLSPKEREKIREYLESSSHHAMSNDAALKALDSIDTLQRTLKVITAHLSVCSSYEEVDVDQIMTWIIKPHTQMPKVKRS